MVSTIFDLGNSVLKCRPTVRRPRRDPKRRSLLVDEHRRRQGDPVMGGSTRTPVMTAYRQEALALRGALAAEPRSVLELKRPRPTHRKFCSGMSGWFVRVERGVYNLTDGPPWFAGRLRSVGQKLRNHLRHGGGASDSTPALVSARRTSALAQRRDKRS